MFLFFFVEIFFDASKSWDYQKAITTGAELNFKEPIRTESIPWYELHPTPMSTRK